MKKSARLKQTLYMPEDCSTEHIIFVAFVLYILSTRLAKPPETIRIRQDLANGGNLKSKKNEAIINKLDIIIKESRLFSESVLNGSNA